MSASPNDAVGGAPAEPHHFAADLAAIARIDAVPSILDIVCRQTGMGFAAVARVTEARWVACSVKDDIGFGLQPGGELVVNTTICDEIRGSGRAVVIDHVATDATYSGHPTPAMYGFQSYISMPIYRPSGRFFGTLCAIDPNPRSVNRPEVVETFRLFAELIGFHLDAQDRLAASEAALAEAQATAAMREKFVAVLGHDLRNPLASISSGTRLLSREAGERGAMLAGMIQASVDRMVALVDDVLDFARGQLGGGITVQRRPDEDLAAALSQVVDEMRSTHTDRLVEADIAITAPVECDAARLAQLLQNLLANALGHGDAVAPVFVRAATEGEDFVLEVRNSGEPIPAETLARLFAPFARAPVPGRPPSKGLGLGLYIAGEIAKAHGGRIDAESAEGETRFTLRMKRVG